MYQPNPRSFSAITPPSVPVAVADEAVELVARYPNLSELEIARLINIYPRLPALDAALMISDEKLAPKLDQFFADHGSKMRTPFRQYAVLVGIGVVGIFAAAWAVAFGS